MLTDQDVYEMWELQYEKKNPKPAGYQSHEEMIAAGKAYVESHAGDRVELATKFFTEVSETAQYNQRLNAAWREARLKIKLTVAKAVLDDLT